MEEDIVDKYQKGMHFLLGQGGCEQNVPTALSLFEEAAREGDPRAQLNFGLMLKKGVYVPARDEGKAFELLSTLSQREDTDDAAVQRLIAQARTEVGVWALNGDCPGAVDEAAALALLEAATAWNADACLNLGLFALERNESRAVDLFKRAIEVNPRCWRAYSLIGVLFYEGGRCYVKRNHTQARKFLEVAGHKGKDATALSLLMELDEQQK